MLPFIAAIKAEARLMMTAHVALPALDGGRDDLPATLSPAIVRRLLRRELGFEGVIITDALNMQFEVYRDRGDAYVTQRFDRTADIELADTMVPPVR